MKNTIDKKIINYEKNGLYLFTQ